MLLMAGTCCSTLNGGGGAWNFTRTTNLRQVILFSTIVSTLLSKIVDDSWLIFRHFWQFLAILTTASVLQNQNRIEDRLEWEFLDLWTSSLMSIVHYCLICEPLKFDTRRDLNSCQPQTWAVKTVQPLLVKTRKPIIFVYLAQPKSTTDRAWAELRLLCTLLRLASVFKQARGGALHRSHWISRLECAK